MKTLQDNEEQVAVLEAQAQLRFHERKPSSPRSIVLLLHGHDERGLRIFRKLVKYLPESAHIIAPNGPFPLPRLKADRLDFGYTWYLYDRFTQSYHIDQTLALSLLQALLKQVNPEKLPVIIVGFSQGGYLAPLMGFQEPLTKLVIGIGCEFRARLFNQSPHYKLIGLHGADDAIIPPDHSQNEYKKLQKLGIKLDWQLLTSTGHEINQIVGEKVAELMEPYAK